LTTPTETGSDPTRPGDPAGLADPSTFFGADWEQLARTDPEVAEAIQGEVARLGSKLQLIASENFTSPAVMAATGCFMTNKYAEGYPGRRYYGGCQQVDVVESLAIDRAKRLFGAEHVNVQPHSGAQANMAAYFAVAGHGDTILAMSLPHGGHLTHGSRVNFSGKWFNVVAYAVRRDSELIDFDEVRDLARQHRPKVIVAGATAYPRVIDFAAFRAIADEVGAVFVADVAHYIGLIAGGAYPSPVPYADIVTFTTHKVLRGPRGGMILCREELGTAVDKAVFPMLQGGPLMNTIAAKAVALAEASAPEFKAYAEQVVANARALAAGLADGGLRLVSGGTDSHKILADLSPQGITGKEAEARLDAVGIVLNKNAIPYDPQPPMVASGVRLGSAAETTAGMREAEMAEVAGLLLRGLRAEPGSTAAAGVREEVAGLVDRFPPYPPAGRAAAHPDQGRPAGLVGGR
jgi:glycine hydroxymethyltransferase